MTAGSPGGALESLLDIRGLRYAALVGADGSVSQQIGPEQPEASVATTARAMLGSLQTAMGSSSWNDLLLDLDGGPMLLTPAGDHILQVAFDDVANLGRVRFGIKRVINKLAGSA